MHSYKFLFLLVFSFLFFGCYSSNDYLIMESLEKQKPLAETDEIKIIFAEQIPVIPENSLVIATIETDIDSECSFNSGMDYLVKKSRELGANYLYIKQVENKDNFIYIYLVGGYVKHCQVIRADFLRVD